MKLHLSFSSLGLLGYLGMSLHCIAEEIPLPPVSAQEMHTWQRSPLTSQAKHGFQSQGVSSEGKSRPESRWRRGLAPSVSYPYIGPYSDGEQLVVEWQLGQAKNCGLDTLFVSVICENLQGRIYINEDGFDTIIAVAEKMNYPVAVMDDSYFRTKEAQSPENVTKRITEFLKKYGGRAGYYKIDNKPVFLLCQKFNFLSKEQIEKMLTDIEREVGNVYWVLTGRDNNDLDKLLPIKCIEAIKGAHSLSTPCGLTNIDGIFQPDLYAKAQKNFIDKCHSAGKKAWVWIYPGFDNRDAWASAHYGKKNMLRQSAQYGDVLNKLLTLSKLNRADHIVITSWSCYMENTQIEASWDFDGYNGDPLARQKQVAAFLGKAWKNPPLPDPSIVDPVLKGRIFGEDSIGPEIRSIQVNNGDLIVFAEDDKSMVKKVKIWINGSAYVLFSNDKITSKNVNLEKLIVSPSSSGDSGYRKIDGTIEITKLLASERISAWAFAIADGNTPAPFLSFPSSPQTYRWEYTDRPVCKLTWQHISHSEPITSGKEFKGGDYEWVKAGTKPDRFESKRLWKMFLPILHFGMDVNNKISVNGSFNRIVLIHPDEFDFILNNPIETFDKGRVATFRIKLPENIKVDDSIFACGIDEHGNIGEPETIKVEFLR